MFFSFFCEIVVFYFPFLSHTLFIWCHLKTSAGMVNLACSWSSQETAKIVTGLSQFFFGLIGLWMWTMYSGQQRHNLMTGKDQLRHHFLGYCGGWPLFICLAGASDFASLRSRTSLCDWLLVVYVQILSCSQLFPCQQARERRQLWWTFSNIYLVMVTEWAPAPVFSSFDQPLQVLILLWTVTLLETLIPVLPLVL